MSTGGAAGGVSGTIEIDDSQVAAAMARLKAEMAATEAQMKKLKEEFAAGTITLSAYTAGMSKLEAAHRSYQGAAAQFTGGMDKAGGASRSFANQLQVVGQSLDDLQYVGEMGLRPILNNLMQISPYLGIAALGFQFAGKAGDDFAESMTNVAKAFLEVAEIELPDGDSMFEGWTKGVDNYVNYIKKVIPEAWGDLSGSTQRGMEQAAKAFADAPRKTDKERGKAIAEAITEYGGGRFFEEMIDPAMLAGGNPAVLAEEQKKLVDLVAKAKGGNREAADELIRRTEGTGVGAQIWAELPETKEAKKEEEKKKQAQEKKDAAFFRDLEAESRANAGLYDFKQKTIREKIGKGQALSEDELSIASPENRERMRDREIKDNEERAKLTERSDDLNWRMRQLTKPDRVGKTLGGEAYTASFQAMTGDSPEVKRLHAIQEILEDIKKNNEKIQLIGRGKR